MYLHTIVNDLTGTNIMSFKKFTRSVVLCRVYLAVLKSKIKK